MLYWNVLKIWLPYLKLWNSSNEISTNLISTICLLNFFHRKLSPKTITHLITSTPITEVSIINPPAVYPVSNKVLRGVVAPIEKRRRDGDPFSGLDNDDDTRMHIMALQRGAPQLGGVHLIKNNDGFCGGVSVMSSRWCKSDRGLCVRFEVVGFFLELLHFSGVTLTEIDTLLDDL